MKALVLSGGGSAGAYHVGVIRCLVDHGHEYDIISGVSVGALVAGFLAQYPKGKLKEGLAEVEKVFLNIRTSDVYRNWHLFPLSVLWKPSLFNTEPLEKLVRSRVDSGRVADSGRILRLGAVSLTSGEYTLFTESYPDIPGAMLASASYPIAFPPVRLDGQQYSDGGVRTVTPLQAALSAGATHCDVVVCQPDLHGGNFPVYPTLIDNSIRTLELMFDEVADDDLRAAGPANTRIFRPNRAVVGNSLKFDPREARAAYHTGIADAREIIRKS